MKNELDGKIMLEKNEEHLRKHRDIKLVTIKIRKSFLVLLQNCHTKKCFSENLLAIEMKKIWILINKPVYLGLSVSEVSKIVMYEFWHDCIKPK